MKRLPTYLSEFQYEALRERAFADRKSMAEVVREAVDRYLVEPAKEAPEDGEDTFVRIIGKFDNPGAPADLSTAHDRYLYEKENE